MKGSATGAAGRALRGRFPSGPGAGGRGDGAAPWAALGLGRFVLAGGVPGRFLAAGEVAEP